MLITHGKALCDDERVCDYGAGTETNPVYLFDKACIEREMPQTKSVPRDSNGKAAWYSSNCLMKLAT